MKVNKAPQLRLRGFARYGVDATPCCLVLAASVLCHAAAREILNVDWPQFRDEVTARHLAGRDARIKLASGKSVRTKVLQVTDTALVVRRTPELSNGREREASIPAYQVRSVRFEGHTGRGRLWGALIGASAGAAVGAAIVAGSDANEGPFVVLLPVIAAGVAGGAALARFLIGSTKDQPAPEFLLTRP